MEPLIVLIVLGILAAPIFLVRWLIVRTNRATRRVEELGQRLSHLEMEVHRLKKSAEPAPPPPAEAMTLAATAPLPAVLLERRMEPKPAEAPIAPPPLSESPPHLAPGVAVSARTVKPPIPPPPLPPPLRVAPSPPRGPTINWEKFLGVKLFAWLGGLALFLGVGFFIKYSFENNLISPQLRVALGYLTGLGLLVTGLKLAREKYAVTVQTLCSVAVLILYANTFACHSFYHFLPALPTFGVMALITAAAFLLAVRLNGQAVTILGLLGGFLTPILLSTGEDRPLGLFCYIGLLDLGLVAVALRQRWNHLVPLALAGTLLMQVGWAEKFFEASKVYTAMTVFIAFAALFVGAFVASCRWKRDDRWTALCAILAPIAAIGFAFYLVGHPYAEIAARPGLLFGFAFLADLALLAAACQREAVRPAHLAGGAAVFLLLTIWTFGFLTNELLNWALGFYLFFAVLHSVFPVVLERLRPSDKPVWWAHLFPPLALVLVLFPLLKLSATSLLIWPVVLLVDLLAILLGIVTASLLSIAAVLLLTLIVTASWIFHVPAELTFLPETLFIVGGFALLFFVASLFAGKKILAKLADARKTDEVTGSRVSGSLQSLLGGDALAHLPALSAALPFLLLIMLVVRLPLANPSPVFGLAALLLVLMLGVVRSLGTDALCAVGLVFVLLLEHVWHGNQFASDGAALPLVWYLGFAAAFFVFPFCFRERLASRVIPWAVSALAAPAHFYLVYDVLKRAWPNAYMGFVPAVFAVPSMLGLLVLIKQIPAGHAKRNTLLALFGGVTLFFITLIFPIQFDKQWITLGWAAEGTALLWLFHRVPHNGLKVVGSALLLVSFARLALNPAVLSYHARTSTPIFNWYLYAYGLVTVCLFIGARLLAPPRHQVLNRNAPPLFYTLGTVLAFLLVNIEIADYFSRGATLTFEFSGDFARDMTYSLAWALFALALLVVGMKQDLTAPRYAGIGLLSVTILKLFLHDLRRLSGLFLIGSLIGLAVVLIASSFIYQRFLSSAARKKPDSTKSS